MKLLDIIREARNHLHENGCVSLRALRRQYDLDDEALAEHAQETRSRRRRARVLRVPCASA